MPKLKSYIIECWSEETYCQYCGLPLVQGDRVYFLGELGPVFCSTGCQRAEEVYQLQKQDRSNRTDERIASR